jgi:hypothetical protein
MTRAPARPRLAAVAAAAVVVLLGLPGAVAADTCACDPIQPYLVTDGQDETHVTYRHSGNPGVVYASNKSGAWVRQRLTSNKDTPEAIAVDDRQKAWIVFEREVGDDVDFRLLTNSGGGWDVSRLPSIHRDGTQIDIRVDSDRNVHLAWTRDESVWYATNASGSWERRRLDNAMGNNVQLALDGAGRVHLVYNQCTNDGSGTCEGAGIWYETNASGTWTQERVTGDQQDDPNDLLVDANGRAHVVFAREYNSQENPDLPLATFYLTNAGGTWKAVRAAPAGRWANIERSKSGAITIVYMRVDDDDRRGIYRSTNASGVWIRGTVVREWALYPSTGISSNGVVHLAYMRMEIDPGIYYSNSRGGDWSRRELMD